MTAILMTTEPVSLRQVAELASSLGLSSTGRSPWSDGIRHASWTGEGGTLTFGMHACSGAGVLVVNDPDGVLDARIAEALPCESDAQARQRAAEATTARERIRQIYRLSTLLLVNSLPPEPILDVIGARLLDDEPLVRWAAARVLRFRSDRHTEALLETAAQRHPDLRSVYEAVSEARVADEDGILYDAPTDDWWELIERARQGVAAGQWKRVERAMDALIDDRPDHAEALLLRGLAHEHAGQPLLALALLGASEADLKFQLRDDEDDDDDDDDDAEDDERTQERRALLEEIAEARPRIESAADEATDEHREAMPAAIEEWFERWSDRGTVRAGAAAALVDRLPALMGPLALVAGSFWDDLPLLRRAVDLVPDAPECRVELARVLRRSGDTQAAEAVLRDALPRLSVPVEERSELARRAHAWTGDSISTATALLALTELAYDAERWDEAAELADQLVQLDPDSTAGWQIRANARTFGGRLEEAAQAYAEAIEAFDRYADDPDSLYFGQDPRPLMHFNRASVLAKLGHHEQSLEQLRHAVRGDRKWGPAAAEDDFFEALWTDEEFLAIVAATPRALILEEEKDPEFLAALVSRCVGLSHMGRVDEAVESCEKAVELGRLQGRLDLVAKAHSVWGRTLAFDGEPEEGLVQLQAALALLPHVPKDEQAEIHHTHGVALHQGGRYDEAEQAYVRAQALRAEVEGEEHPVLAKSYGDLARLAADRGDPPERAAELTAQGLALLDRYIEQHADDITDTVREAEMDACILQVNIGHSRAQADDVTGALEVLEQAAQRIRAAFEHDTRFGSAFLDNATGLARSLTELTEPAQRVRAQAVLRALEVATLSGPPEEIEERLFWRRLAGLARRLRRHGVDDAAFAGAMQRAIRGELSAAELSAVPEMAGLPAQLGARVERYPTLLAMIAMSLSTVQADGMTLEEALENLEELCVGSLYGDPAQE